MYSLRGMLLSSFIATCLFTPNLSAQWLMTNGPTFGTVECFAVSGQNLFAGISGGAGHSGAVYISTNSGIRWIYADSGLMNNDVYSLAVLGTRLYAASYGGTYMSTDNGTSWTSVIIPFAKHTAITLAVKGTDLLAGTTSGILVSADSGTTWTQAGLNNTFINAIVVDDTNLFAGTATGAFLSTNDGSNWTAIDSGLTSLNVSSLGLIGNHLLAGTSGGGIFLSTDDGTSWTYSGLINTFIYSFAVSGTNLFAGTNAGVFLSTDSGTVWTAVDSGLTNTDIHPLVVFDNNLLAGTNGAGTWWRPLSQMVTAILNYPEHGPRSFALNQNYPNPFNPSTVINYQLPVNGFVTVKIFDVLGREVKTLVNERQAAGAHSITFNADNLPSGVYFYRLQTGTFMETKKMTVLR